MRSESIWENRKFHIFILVFLATTIIFGKLEFGGLPSFDDCYYLYVLTVPVGFREEKNADIKRLSSCIRENTTEREEVLIYKMNYWLLQNPLLFYADRPTTREIKDEDSLERRLRSSKKLTCLARVSDYGRLKRKYKIIRKEGSLVFFSNK